MVFAFIIVLFWASPKSESEIKTTLPLKVKYYDWPLSFPLFFFGIRMPNSMAVSLSVSPSLQRILLNPSKMSLLIARTFLALVWRLCYGPSGDHGQVVGSMVLRNKTFLTFHLLQSSVPLLTIMPRYPVSLSHLLQAITVKASKTHSKVHESKIQVSLWIFWTPNHAWVLAGQQFPDPISSTFTPTLVPRVPANINYLVLQFIQDVNYLLTQ